jgi:hypothetical protein
VAALCADNSVTDCVIVEAGDADAGGGADGEEVGSAAIALMQSIITSRQKILTAVIMHPRIDEFCGDFLCIWLESRDPFEREADQIKPRWIPGIWIPI